ncbi:MAG: hypothetical protein M0Z28_23065 [Rhodospirillales bacterium]|nr:hypothetical protein [Rhodospirillales bacterium]
MRSRLLAALLLCGSLALPACALTPAQQATLPHTYLEQALAAVQAHDAPKALAALNKAENAWLGTNVPFTDPFFGFDPDAMREMARARQSVQMGRWGDAEYYIRTAMTHPSTIVPG